MPLRLEIKKKLSARSDRVKSVEIHPSEPWVLSALYNGNVYIWDYDSGALVKSFEVSELPIRCAKFVVRKQWFVACSDDLQIRAYNYNTMEKITAFDAHTDYIRYLEVHPSLPHLLSCSDDCTIKLWDWEKGWDCTQVFEGHAHYVMMVRFNPKDTNTFASASLDRSIKVWGLGSAMPHFSLDGHEKGVNAVDYYPGGDKPYLISGSDDKQVKIWDYQTKTCIQTLEGHSNNVCAVCFHPRLPVIVSGSEDGTVRIFHATTYRAETTLNYGLERVWTLSATRETNKVAIGFDEGTICIKLGSEMPVASLDTHTSKVVWSKGGEISAASFKGMAAEDTVDGERLTVSARDMGSTEIFPQELKHNCNGRFVVVIGDGEYIIYTSQALRNKSYGSALDFVWSSVGTGDYAIRESISRVKTFRNFKEHKTIKPAISSAEGICGGALLGVRGADCVLFFDWDDAILIRQIDVAAKSIYWNENGELLALVCDDSYFILKYDRELANVAISQNAVPPDGIEGAFELLHQIEDKVGTGHWVGDCFLYTNSTQRLNYYVGGQVMTLVHLDQPAYMLGYLPKENRVYLSDKQGNFISYRVLQPVLQYQTAIVRQDFEVANAILPQIPESEFSDVARFLESQGFKEEALAVSRDSDQKFDLAIELGKLELALELLEAVPEEDKDTTEVLSKWKRLGDLALQQGNLSLAKRCALSSDDVSGLLLLCSAAADAKGMEQLGHRARSLGKTNVAFLAFFLLGKVEDCLELLIESNRIPEAAFLARCYLPSQMSRLVGLWKEEVQKTSEKNAEALADPSEFPNLFDDLDIALQVEQVFLKQREVELDARNWPKSKEDISMNLIDFMKDKLAGAPPPPPVEEAAAPPAPVSEPESQAEDSATKELAAAKELAEEQAAAKRLADKQAAAKRLADEQAAAKQLADEQAAAKRLADEQAAAKQLADEQVAAKRLADEQAALKQLADEQAAAKRLAEEMEAKRRAEQEAERLKKQQAEAARLAAEQEAKRKADEEARLKAEKEAQEEAARKAAEEADKAAKEVDDILDDDFGDDW